MTNFAKDVAKQLDRRRQRRRLAFLAAGAALVVLAIMFLRCGSGWGLGGKGSGGGGGSAGEPAHDAGPKRCAIRVDAKGISVDGKPETRAEAVSACAKTTGADVVVTGDARQGTWDELRAALEAAKIPVFVRGP